MNSETIKIPKNPITKILKDVLVVHVTQEGSKVVAKEVANDAVVVAGTVTQTSNTVTTATVSKKVLSFSINILILVKMERNKISNRHLHHDNYVPPEAEFDELFLYANASCALPHDIAQALLRARFRNFL